MCLCISLLEGMATKSHFLLFKVFAYGLLIKVCVIFCFFCALKSKCAKNTTVSQHRNKIYGLSFDLTIPCLPIERSRSQQAWIQSERSMPKVSLLASGN